MLAAVALVPSFKSKFKLLLDNCVENNHLRAEFGVEDKPILQKFPTRREVVTRIVLPWIRLHLKWGHFRIWMLLSQDKQGFE